VRRWVVRVGRVPRRQTIRRDSEAGRWAKPEGEEANGGQVFSWWVWRPLLRHTGFGPIKSPSGVAPEGQKVVMTFRTLAAPW